MNERIIRRLGSRVTKQNLFCTLGERSERRMLLWLIFWIESLALMARDAIGWNMRWVLVVSAWIVRVVGMFLLMVLVVLDIAFIQIGKRTKTMLRKLKKTNEIDVLEVEAELSFKSLVSD